VNKKLYWFLDTSKDGSKIYFQRCGYKKIKNAWFGLLNQQTKNHASI